MDIFAKRLRERAAQLGISNAEAGRRAGLDERRFAHYANDRREPDLATLIRIAEALNTSPNWLLGFGMDVEATGALADLQERLHNASAALPEAEVKLLCVVAEALGREQD